MRVARIFLPFLAALAAEFMAFGSVAYIFDIMGGPGASETTQRVFLVLWFVLCGAPGLAAFYATQEWIDSRARKTLHDAPTPL